MDYQKLYAESQSQLESEKLKLARLDEKLSSLLEELDIPKDDDIEEALLTQKELLEKQLESRVQELQSLEKQYDELVRSSEGA